MFGMQEVEVEVEVEAMALAPVRAWWSIKGLLAVRWLLEHGFDPSPELEVLRSQQ